MAKATQKAAEKTASAATATLPAADETKNLPANMASMLEADAGAGRENVTAEDQAIPFISILQKGSPQVDPASPNVIEGAVVGQIIDSVSQRRWDGKKGILGAPVFYARDYVEWIIREEGGGFVKSHGLDGAKLLATTRKDDKKRDILPNGHQLVTTANHYLQLLDEDANFRPLPCLLAMTSTQLKKSRRWNTNMGSVEVLRDNGSGYTAPTWLVAYRLITVQESNKAGTWFGWEITPERILVPAKTSLGDLPVVPNGDSIYGTCKLFLESLRKGTVKVAAPPGGSAEAGASEDPEDPPY